MLDRDFIRNLGIRRIYYPGAAGYISSCSLLVMGKYPMALLPLPRVTPPPIHSSTPTLLRLPLRPLHPILIIGICLVVFENLELRRHLADGPFVVAAIYIGDLIIGVYYY